MSTLTPIDIPWDYNVKYLGLTLDSKLKFGHHIAATVDKINLTTRVLYPFINRKSQMRIENKLILLKTIFHAIMFYGAPV